MKATIQESINVSDARSRRATALCAAVRRQRDLAERGQYPLSLHEICRRALEREYLLGRKRGRTDADA